MNFDLSDEHMLLEQSTREWAAREVAPRIQQLDHEHTFDRALLPKMAALGLLITAIVFLVDPSWFHAGAQVHWPEPTFRNFIAVALLALLASRPHSHAHGHAHQRTRRVRV